MTALGTACGDRKTGDRRQPLAPRSLAIGHGASVVVLSRYGFTAADLMSPALFHAADDVADQPVMYNGAHTHFRSGSFAAGVALSMSSASLVILGQSRPTQTNHIDTTCYQSTTLLRPRRGRHLTSPRCRLPQQGASLPAARRPPRLSRHPRWRRHPAVPGESSWVPGRLDPTGTPTIYTSFFRPDPRHPCVVAGGAWIRARDTTAHLVAGTREPGGIGWPGGAHVVTGDVSMLVATFNSGWKMSDAGGGF